MPGSPPPSCVLERIASADIEPTLRFDAWRERAHTWVEMLPPTQELDAELLTLHGNTCLFGTMRSSAYEMRAATQRIANAPDMLVLTLIQSGELLRDALPGEHQRAGAGALGVYDPRRIGDYRWSQGSREVFLALPRHEALDALGREPGNLSFHPAHCALAPMLASQMDHLARLAHQPARMGIDEYAALLEGTRALALLMLRNLGRQGTGIDLPDRSESLGAGRRAAALRFMEHNAQRHDLNAAAIAHGIGCSRTRLYEAFAAHGATVMAALRELRLQRAREMIERSPRLHVGALSWRCGFADASDFSKRFRARFGLSPSEWHRQTRMNATPGHGLS